MDKRGNQMINIIQKTTAERKQETIILFEKIRPLLDEGYSFNKALKEITDLSVTQPNKGWLRDLINYAKTQGYDYHEYKWKRGKKQDNNI